MQGDIIGLLDGSGASVVEYIYDSWGKILTIKGIRAKGEPYRKSLDKLNSLKGNILNQVVLVMEVLVTTLIYIVINYFLYCMKWYAIFLWFNAVVGFISSISGGFRQMYLQNINDYPAEHCYNPDKYKFLFRKFVKLSWKGIPKEIYYTVLINYYLLWIYSIIVFFVLLWDGRVACVAGFIYFSIVIILFLGCTYSLTMNSFLSRYKLCNKHNIKYYFFSKNEPYPRKIGKCQIIDEHRKWRRTFVTVSIIETGEIMDKVLLSGKKRKGENPVYSIYEICGVYYIV